MWNKISKKVMRGWVCPWSVWKTWKDRAYKRSVRNYIKKVFSINED